MKIKLNILISNKKNRYKFKCLFENIIWKTILINRLMLMKTLALEYGKDKIRVNSIAPGAIQTAINESVWSSKKEMENLLKLIPYGRIGQVEDVANAALWLASDESDYVTGTTIFVDGGMSCYPGFLDNG